MCYIDESNGTRILELKYFFERFDLLGLLSVQIYNNGERTFEIKKGRVELRSNVSVIDSRKNFSRL